MSKEKICYEIGIELSSALEMCVAYNRYMPTLPKSTKEEALEKIIATMEKDFNKHILKAIKHGTRLGINFSISPLVIDRSSPIIDIEANIPIKEIVDQIKNIEVSLEDYLFIGFFIAKIPFLLAELSSTVSANLALKDEKIDAIFKARVEPVLDSFNLLTRMLSINFSNEKRKILSYKILSYFDIHKRNFFIDKHNPSIEWNFVVKDIENSLFNKKIEHRRSRIDSSRVIHDDSFVLSLVRKIHGSHAEHAFLVIEGKKDNKALIWFIDFVGNPILPGIINGKVRVCRLEGELTDKNLIFGCDKRMMDIRRGDRLSSTSWNISCELAYKMVEAIELEKSNPPKFNILGKRSIFAASTGASSSFSTGHNCFTWAKEQIRNLNDSNVSIPEDDLMSYIFSRTSYLLVDDSQQRNSFWYQRPIVIASLVGAAAIAGAVASSNAETIANSCRIS